jgi:hypothetical protein
MSDGPVEARPAAGPGGSGGGSDRTPSPGDDGEAALAAGWAVPEAAEVADHDGELEDGAGELAIGGEDEAEQPPRGAAAPRLAAELRPTPPRLVERGGSATRTAAQWRRLPTKLIVADDSEASPLPKPAGGVELPGTATSPATEPPLSSPGDAAAEKRRGPA